MTAYGLGHYGIGLYGIGADGPLEATADLGDGIVFGQTDVRGIRWSLQRGSDPFGNSPPPREVSGPRVRAHGAWNATRYYESREWQISLQVFGEHTELHLARHRLAAVCGINPVRVVVDEPHFGRRWADFRRRGSLEWSETSPNTATASLVLVADDPLIRGDLQTASTGPAASVGGLRRPARLPRRWDAQVSSGLLELDNEGLEPASVKWRIQGPIVDPYLVDVATGRTLRTTLSLGVGEYVEFDSATERAWAQGDIYATRTSQTYGRWFDIAPGGSQVKFGGASVGAGALVTAEWCPTWV